MDENLVIDDQNQQPKKKSQQGKKRDWSEIRIDYMRGIPTSELSKIHNVEASQISRRATKENWGNPKKIAEDYNLLATATATIVEKAIAQDENLMIAKERLDRNLIGKKSSEEITREIAAIAMYKADAHAVNSKVMQSLSKVIDKLPTILDQKDGLYVSKVDKDGGKTYDRVTKFVADLAPIISENNKVMGLTTATAATVNLQNNINTDDKDNAVVQLYIPDNNR